MRYDQLAFGFISMPMSEPRTDDGLGVKLLLLLLLLLVQATILRVQRHQQFDQHQRFAEQITRTR